MKATCPCCGRALPKAKPTVNLVPSADWTDSQIFAHYKHIAPIADLAFTRRNASPELQARIDAIARPTPKDAADIRTARRIELADAERASNSPAIGSERWHAEYNAIAEALAELSAIIAPFVETDTTNESEAA